MDRLNDKSKWPAHDREALSARIRDSFVDLKPGNDTEPAAPKPNNETSVDPSPTQLQAYNSRFDQPMDPEVYQSSSSRCYEEPALTEMAL
jgi:hypothetical protein